MSKLNKPNSVILIGANIYQDYVQRAYIERVYPYIKDARYVTKYPMFTDSLLDSVIKSVKSCKTPTAMFILDRYYEKIIKCLDSRGYGSIKKDGTLIYSIDDSILIVKEINFFEQIPNKSKIVNKNVSEFKLFGKPEALEKLSRMLEEHATIKVVLDSWYNIEVKDIEGEEILTKIAKELDIKVLPIRSVRASLVEYLTAKKKTISMAESCTGGLLASKLTAVSGASAVLEGAMVTYSNRIKQEWLGVDAKTLEKYGAVSKETVKEMLDGIQKVANSDIAVAISGIAGPTGGTKEKPVGTVYIGVKNINKTEIKKFNFNGDRGFIQEQSARAAIEMILYLENEFFNFF